MGRNAERNTVPKRISQDAEKSRILMNELLDEIVQVYTVDCKYNIKYTADQLEMSSAKVRKLLITANERDEKKYYSSDIAESIIEMYHQGKTVPEIMNATNLGNHAVQGYLPYSKTIYNLSQLSGDAKRLRLSRYRKSLCANYTTAIIGMSKEEEEEYFWKTLSEVSGRIFYTAGKNGKGSIKFTYTIKNSEMFINKEETRIDKVSVMKGYHKARKMGFVKGPSALDISGAIYLYPIFLEMQICRAE